MPRQPEGRLVNSALAYLRGTGGRWFKIHGGDNPFQEVGIPDIIGCYQGRFVGLEAKMPGNKTSPKQQLVLDEIVAAGGYASVFTTVEEVASFLATIQVRSNPEASNRKSTNRSSRG
jgi:hypothetical protein